MAGWTSMGDPMQGSDIDSAAVRTLNMMSNELNRQGNMLSKLLCYC